MNLIFRVFIFTIFYLSLSAQNRNLETLSYLSVDKPKDRNRTLVQSPEYLHVLSIYDKLVNCKGDFRYPVPQLVMSKDEKYVASMDYNTLQIDVEEKAYRVCQKYGNGDAAIAFLLAHELTHYYEKHAWKNAFVHEMSQLQIGKDLKEMQDKVMNETQADYLGGYLAYSAGYGLFDQGAELLTALYKEYNFKDTLKIYPVLSERIELTKRCAAKIKKLAEVFEMGNLLTSIGKYTEAYLYYKYILMDYQSRELYNNLGNIAVLSAMPLMDPDSLVFQYVSEMDTKFSSSRDASNELDSILRQAIQHFDAAISLDPKYAPAYLNKANAYALLGDLEKAKFYLNYEALPAANANLELFSKTKSDIFVLNGILAARNKDTLASATFFNEAIKMNDNRVAKINLDILQHKKPAKFRATVSRTNTESIGDMSIQKFIDAEFRCDQKNKINLDGENFFCENQIDSSYSIFLNAKDEYDENGNYPMNPTVFLMTKKGYQGSTKLGIKIGDNADSLKLYGVPIQTVESVQGSIVVYEKHIFIVNLENKIEQWITYLKKG